MKKIIKNKDRNKRNRKWKNNRKINLPGVVERACIPNYLGA
jgi:hypothetical protein